MSDIVRSLRYTNPASSPAFQRELMAQFPRSAADIDYDNMRSKKGVHDMVPRYAGHAGLVHPEGGLRKEKYISPQQAAMWRNDGGSSQPSGMSDAAAQNASMQRLQSVFGDDMRSAYEQDMEQMIGRLRGRYMTDIDMPGHPNGWRQQ